MGRNHTGLPPRRLAIFEDHQCWHTLYTQSIGQLWIAVDIDLENAHLIPQLGSHLF